MLRISEELACDEGHFQCICRAFWRPYTQCVLRQIHEEIDRLYGISKEWPHTEPSQELKDDWVIGEAMERFVRKELGG